MPGRTGRLAIALLDLLFGFVALPSGLKLLDWVASGGHPGLSVAVGDVSWAILVLAPCLLVASVVSAGGALAARRWGYLGSLGVNGLAILTWVFAAIAGLAAPEMFPAALAIALGLVHAAGLQYLRSAFRP